MNVCTRTETVGITDQDYLSTLHENRIVRNSAFYPSPRITITIWFPTCTTSTEIKFVTLCCKLTFVNKALPCIIEFVSCIITVLYFLFFYAIVADLFYSFYLNPDMIVHTPCNVIILFSTHLPAAINCATGSNPNTTPYNASIMTENFRNLHRFKIMCHTR